MNQNSLPPSGRPICGMRNGLTAASDNNIPHTAHNIAILPATDSLPHLTEGVVGMLEEVVPFVITI